MNCSDALRTLPPLPESVQKVLCELYSHPPMTSKELREKTGLPRRTVYSAIVRLRELGLLNEQLSLRDTRQRYVWLDTARLGVSFQASPAPPVAA